MNLNLICHKLFIISEEEEEAFAFLELVDDIRRYLARQFLARDAQYCLGVTCKTLFNDVQLSRRHQSPRYTALPESLRDGSLMFALGFQGHVELLRWFSTKNFASAFPSSSSFQFEYIYAFTSIYIFFLGMRLMMQYYYIRSHLTW